MKINGAIEIISFNSQEGVTADQFLSEVGVLDQFFKGFEGYNDMKVLKEENGLFTLVIHWDSAEAEKSATVQMMKSDDTKPFMQMVQPASVSKKVVQCFSS